MIKILIYYNQFEFYICNLDTTSSFFIRILEITSDVYITSRRKKLTTSFSPLAEKVAFY